MKNTFLNVSLIAVAILVSALTYSNLSPEIAIHWTDSEVTGTAHKLVGVLLIPVVMIVTYGILYLLFKIDPKKENLSHRNKSMSISTILFLLFAVHVTILAIGLGNMSFHHICFYYYY